MKWLPQYATGIDLIDTQHRLLFKIATDFRAAIDAGEGPRVYGEFLDSLDAYAKAHFTHEERCMEQSRCPLATMNCSAHRRFLWAIARFRERYADGGLDANHAREFVAFLEYWLVSHIGGIDVQLKHYPQTPGE